MKESRMELRKWYWQTGNDFRLAQWFKNRIDNLFSHPDEMRCAITSGKFHWVNRHILYYTPLRGTQTFTDNLLYIIDRHDR
jgi:hypothetical protein